MSQWAQDFSIEKWVKVFSTNEWLYPFDLYCLSGNIAKIRFEDKAMNRGSYHTVATFLADINEGEIKVWNYSTKRY